MHSLPIVFRYLLGILSIVSVRCLFFSEMQIMLAMACGTHSHTRNRILEYMYWELRMKRTRTAHNTYRLNYSKTIVCIHEQKCTCRWLADWLADWNTNSLFHFHKYVCVDMTMVPMEFPTKCDLWVGTSSRWTLDTRLQFHRVSLTLSNLFVFVRVDAFT